MKTRSPSNRLRQGVSGLPLERRLLIGCFFAAALGFLMMAPVAGSGRLTFEAIDFRWLLIYGVGLLGVPLVRVISRLRGDPILFAAAAWLSGLGLLAQYRLASLQTAALSPLIQSVFPASLTVMLIVALGLRRGRYQRLESRAWLWGAGSLALIALILATGQRFRGAVYAGGLITPTELLKVTVILFVAGFITRRAARLSDWGQAGLVPPVRALGPLIAFWVVLGGLLVLQRDWGMFLILSVTLWVMLFMGTARAAYLLYGVLGASGLGYVAWKFVPHVQQRIDAWQSPFLDPTGGSWQILQGLSGLYAGGLWGEGFGQGHPHLTPIAQSDFIYAVIGEELGYVGCVLAIVCYLILIYRGLRIAALARSPFGRLVSTGLTTVLATQTFLNIGGVTKFIPLTGLTLPFISHGGSSLMTCFISLGLLLAIAADEAPRSRPRTPGRNDR